jgi:D-alanyl-D-alanine carboxypeptidase
MCRFIAAGIAFLVTMSLPSSGLCAANPTSAVMPRDGPVREIFENWLRAVNSGDATAIKAFYGKYLNDENPVFALENAADTCGFLVDRVEASSAIAMTVVLRQRCLPGKQRLKLELAADGVNLKTLEFRPLVLPGDDAIKATTLIADRLTARNEFAGSIIVERGSTKLLARSWGFTDDSARSLMTLETPMLLASAGKMFTAVAVLQLTDAGKIELDAPLGTYLTIPIQKWPK